MPSASQNQILQSLQACDVVLETNGFNKNALRLFGWHPRVINGIEKSENDDTEYFQTASAVVTIQTDSSADLDGEIFLRTCTSFAKIKGRKIDNNKQLIALVNHWTSKDAYINTVYGTTYTYEENSKLYTLRAIYLINGPAVQITVQHSIQ